LGHKKLYKEIDEKSNRGQALSPGWGQALSPRNIPFIPFVLRA